MSDRAKLNAASFIEFLSEDADIPFKHDDLSHMAVCHGCGAVVWPSCNCGTDSRESPLCDRLPQPMTYGHIADLLTAAEARIAELEAEVMSWAEAAYDAAPEESISDELKDRIIKAVTNGGPAAGGGESKP